MKIYHKCNKHPKYQGILKPRCKCKDCEKIYKQKHCSHDYYNDPHSIGDLPECVKCGVEGL